MGRAGGRFLWDEKQQNPHDRPDQVLGGLSSREKCWKNSSLKEKVWRSLWQQEKRAGRQDCPAEEEQERAQGWCRGLSVQSSAAKLLLWNKICWNVDTPIPE